MNGIARILFALLSTLLLGCVDRATESGLRTRERIDDQSGADVRTVVSLDQLRGVHPNSPLILKTDTFDFRSANNGATIITADRRGVGLWNMATGTRTCLIEHSDIVLAIALNGTDDGLLTVATGKATPARLWCLKTGKLLKEFPSPFESIVDPSRIIGEDYGWNLWQHPDIWRFTWTGIVPEDGFGFTCAAFGPTGLRIAIGCEDGRVIIWNATTAEPSQTLDTGIPRLLGIAWSADGSRLLVAGKDDRIQLWSVDESKMIRQFEETRRENWVKGYRPAITFAADGSKFALYSPKELAILICDSISGDELHRIPEQSRLPRGKLEVSLRRGLGFIDNSTLFSNTGGWIKIWDFTNGQLIQQQECKSGVNPWYAYPSIQYVEFLPMLDAFVAVEVESDENTGHEDWITVSFRPRRLFERVQ